MDQGINVLDIKINCSALKLLVGKWFLADTTHTYKKRLRDMIFKIGIAS